MKKKTRPGVDKVKPKGWFKTSLHITDRLRSSVGLFHHVLVYMGDLQLAHPALNLSTLDAGIYGTPPSCLKVRGGGGWVAYSILVSAQGPLVLGLGLKGLGPGLDNSGKFQVKFKVEAKVEGPS